jgi:hypothetical protein
MGIAFRVIATSGPEIARRCGNFGPSFGKKCHVVRKGKLRLAGFSGIMGTAFIVFATSSRVNRTPPQRLRGTFGKECHVSV